MKVVILLASIALSLGETDQSESDLRQSQLPTGAMPKMKMPFVSKKGKSKTPAPKLAGKYQAYFPATPAGASPATRKEMCPDPQIPKATKRMISCTIWDIFGEGTVAAEEQTDEYLEWYAQ